MAVNRISKLPKLKVLFLAGDNILSPAVFDIDGENENAWRYLKYLYLGVSKMTPSGGWYFTGDRGSAVMRGFLLDVRWENLDGDLPWFDFRFHPDPITFNPFLIAMARAIVRMPALKRFTCMFHEAAVVNYYGPGYFDKY
ncbi:dihydroxyacetone kinase Dak1 [Hypoxylon texense]